jgi:hemolysin activation/secretion protein
MLGYVCLAVIASAMSVPAYAQAPAGRPAGAGRIEQRFEAEPATEQPKAPLPSIPAAPQPKLPAGPGGSFNLAAVDIEGTTVYSADELAALYQPFLARETDLAGVQRLIDAITDKYRADGYFLSRAEALPQDLQLGVLQVKVIEGFIETVSFDGVAPQDQTPFQGMAARITEQRPARLATLERYLLLMQDTPGVSVTPRLAARDDTTGAYALVVQISKRTVEASLHFDNYGSSLVGPLQQSGSIALNGIIGEGTRTRATVAFTPADPHELKYIELAHDIPLRTEGTRLILNASLGKVHSAGSPSEPDVKTDSFFARMILTHPLIRTRKQTLSLAGQFDVESVQQLQPQLFAYHDQLRVLRVSATEQLIDDFGGTNLFSAQLSHGLDTLGASGTNDPNVSRAGGRADFTKINFTAGRRQVISPMWAMQFGAQVQRSATPLLLTEQVGVGGDRFGRGFDPSAITGDDGEAGASELQFSHDTGNDIVPWYQLFVFLDAGETYFHGINGAGRQSLAATGTGIRLKLGHYLSGEFMVTFPVAQDVAAGNSRKGNSLYFSLNADL